MNKAHFSHVYIEKGAEHFPDARKLLDRFPEAVRVEIADYKHVFNRARQDFQYQKQSMKLILAVKKDQFLYRGSDNSPAFGHDRFFYNTMILNCLYNCDYCYLQGMFTSANIVIFVNSDDFFTTVDEELTAGPLYLCISYDTDLLALEKVHPLCDRWIRFASSRPDLTIEIRTKSGNFGAIKHLQPVSNVILAWTLSPPEVVKTYERQTPPLEQRLRAIAEAVAEGWNVRLCFDPVLAIEDWPAAYTSFIDSLHNRISWGRILDVSVGTFRMNAEYLSKIKSRRTDSSILYGNFIRENGTAAYEPSLNKKIIKLMREKLGPLVSPERLHL